MYQQLVFSIQRLSASSLDPGQPSQSLQLLHQSPPLAAPKRCTSANYLGGPIPLTALAFPSLAKADSGDAASSVSLLKGAWVSHVYLKEGLGVSKFEIPSLALGTVSQGMQVRLLRNARRKGVSNKSALPLHIPAEMSK